MDAIRLHSVGRTIAIVGAVLPLLLIGGLKFTAPEIEALKPLISGTPWLAWLYPLFGEAGASYFIGLVEIVAGLLMLASFWSPRLGIVGAALAALTFFTTSTLMAVLPVWDERLGGFPALNPGGQFLIKDVALLGIALFVAADCWMRIAPMGGGSGAD